MRQGSNGGAFEVGAVVLAAGKSRRMGTAKLLLPWQGTTVLGHILAVWSRLGVRQIVIVCTEQDQPLAEELQRLEFPPADRIYNAHSKRGMFSSIQCAAAWGGWRDAVTHWAIILGDQPHLRPGTLKTLLEFGRANPGQICQPASAGRPRHPVLLPRQFFLELALGSWSKLSEFLANRQVALCEMDDPGLDLDLDRPEDYQRALEMMRG